MARDEGGQSESISAEPRSLWSKLTLLLKRCGQGMAAIVALYLLILLIGLIPVNNAFEPTREGVPVFVISSEVHADIVVPISHAVMDWRREFPRETFLNDINDATHIAFGWGDRGFYVDTPTWADLKLSTAANALLTPSECCLHVQLMRMEGYSEARSIWLSIEQYEKLIAFINRSFKQRADGARILIPNSAYGYNDAFFAAPGNYHVLNTCNSWVGHGLRSSGVRAPLLSPLPGTPTLYLPDEPVDSTSERDAPN